jgi:HD-GYP domain-containing protein (c-di-GMP phosphodiesterase class II)
MRRHTFETYQILSRIDGIDGLAEWAAFHHETLTGEGVPFHHSGEESAQGARIVEVADVFQALAAERPYRRSMDPPELLRVMREMAESGKLDPDLVDLTARNADSCWEAAMGLGGLPA